MQNFKTKKIDPKFQERKRVLKLLKQAKNKGKFEGKKGTQTFETQCSVIFKGEFSINNFTFLKNRFWEIMPALKKVCGK